MCAGQPQNPYTLLAKRRDGLGRRRLDRIGNGQNPGRLLVDAYENGGRAILTQFVCLLLKGADVDPAFRQKTGIAQADALAIHRAERALAGWRIEVRDFGKCRSEEHTSELQSLMRISYAVFCLKKKTNNKHKHEKQH